MGGGKETPRQKMIGMMYLVLMAMLALNVSKSIIDAFVAIEENIQIASQNEHARGLEKITQLDEQAKSGDTPEVRAKAKKLLESCNAIDKLTAEQIKYLDALKMEILTEIKEDPAKLKPGPESIIMVPYDDKFPLRPIRMNLTHVTNKDKYDEGMRIFGIADNLKLPGEYKCKSSNTAGGIQLWKNLLKFRDELCSIMVASSSNDSVKYSFTDPDIIKYKDLADLQKQVTTEFKKCKISPEDYADVEKIYIALTKNQDWEDEHHPEGVHWLGKIFNHAPSVAAIASISGLQKEILTARADAISLIRSRLGAGEYSFNKIVGLAFPETAVLNPGDQFEVTVMMAAFDSDKQPVVKPSQGSVVKVADGRATLKLTAPQSGDMVIKGVVGIANKRGEIKEMPYETKVAVNSSNKGSIGLPETAVLYADWDNKITAAAGQANLKSMTVSVNGKPCVKKGEYYIVRVNPSAKPATITVTSKDKNDKTATFSQTVKIRPFPEPSCLTTKLSKNGGPVTVGLKGAILDGVQFKVNSVKIGGQTINGNVIPGTALRPYSSGSMAPAEIKWQRVGTNQTGTLPFSFTIQ
jgi:hypothetical protein